MSTRYGRVQVPESLTALARLHRHAGGPLREVTHEPPLAVLDQEDLFAQGIDTSALVPGAKRVDALGSCTANAATVALSNALDHDAFLHATGCASYQDTTSAEEWAIRFYAKCTHQTGDPAQEWPPTDCGSSGPYVVQELEALKLVTDERIAHGADDLVSLLQDGGVLMGSPFFASWEEPDNGGFVDDDGSVSALEAAIDSGVAGGHETYIFGIEALALTATGRVDPQRTVLLVRNSWTASWGDHGCFRIHLSTLGMIGQYCDFRQLVA